MGRVVRPSRYTVDIMVGFGSVTSDTPINSLAEHYIFPG